MQLNGKPVELSGNQMIWPSQSTTYHVTVFHILNGVPGEKTASTCVAVHDAANDQFCPNIPFLSDVEIWEPDPQQPGLLNPWLTEPLSVPDTTMLLGPSFVLNFNSANDEEVTLLFSPGGTLVSACAFMPGIPIPSLDNMLQEASDPAATPSTI